MRRKPSKPLPPTKASAALHCRPCANLLSVKRREFVQLGSVGVLGASAGAASVALTRAAITTATAAGGAQPERPPPRQLAAAATAERAGRRVDITLRIAPVTVELAPTRIISTIGYNGTSPGPILRMREGAPVSVLVINDTDVPELVHWHGLLVPADVDGAEEEGTPFVEPHGQRLFEFTPRPAGTRWYHTHTMAMTDLHRGSYTGQFGFLMIDSGRDPGHYDQELFLALRDWEPFFTTQLMDTDEQNQRWPQTERPALLDTRPNGLEVSASIYSINDKALGAGEPIRVRAGQRLLMHILNASGIENRALALPGHQFTVVALDGNPVPNPRPIDQLFIGPGERVDAYVDMSSPGVWILGAPEDDIRNAGLGVIIEYANQRREPQWVAPARPSWDYTLFARGGPSSPAGEPVAAAPARALEPARQVIDMAFDKVPRGHGLFNSFLVNGKEYPHEQEFVLRQGEHYRLIWRNRTDDAHPLHLHRHLFELVEIYGKRISGLLKDTVVVPYYGRAVVDFVADQPGLSLFHCHIQQHMDFGFKALFRYA
jgi:FtsP/CotA-like multicopper oxidase with cupredoxin domain